MIDCKTVSYDSCVYKKVKGQILGEGGKSRVKLRLVCLVEGILRNSRER